jgi:chromosome segregation ATPase
MISLQQIKELEQRVLKAVEVINSLRDENTSLRGKLEKYENKVRELENLVESFKKEQQQIESGILDTIRKLDLLEDSHNAGNSVKPAMQNDTGSNKKTESGAIESKQAENSNTDIKDEDKTVFSEPENKQEHIVPADEELDIF